MHLCQMMKCHKDKKLPYVVVLYLNRSAHVQDIFWQMKCSGTHISANMVTDYPNNPDICSNN